LVARRIRGELPAVATCVVLVLFAAWYPRHTCVAVPTGDTQLGRFYGWISLALVVFLASYSLRKRWQILWPGSLETWLRWHLFLSVLALALVSLHSGFRFGGAFEAGSLVLLTATVINGLLGVVLFMFIPSLLSALDTRSRVADLPEEIAGAMDEIRQIAHNCSQPLRTVVEREVLGELERPGVSWRKRELAASEELLRTLGSSRFDEDTEVLKRLCELAAEVVDKHQQVALHRNTKLIEAAGLHIHVALTTALLFLVAAHLFTVWYY